MPLTYSFALLALFAMLLLAEFFVPSAGMVGLAALVVAVTAIAIAFTHSAIAGIGITLAVLLIIPIILFSMVRYWPRTPIGRVILNRRPGQIDEPTESRLRGGERRKDLVGKFGIAKTNLLPSGLVEVDSKRIDAVSDGAPIDAGSRVEVVSVVAGKIRVRATVKDSDPLEQDVLQHKKESIESTLASLDLDDFDDLPETENFGTGSGPS